MAVTETRQNYLRGGGQAPHHMDSEAANQTQAAPTPHCNPGDQYQRATLVKNELGHLAWAHSKSTLGEVAPMTRHGA